jgi:arabinofuranan 3-O-arabinosyltransferase
LILGSFLQQPGRTTFDTKLDLTTDPVTFLERALHLWNPMASLGELQNQAYGYFFPQGAYFAAADLMHLPMWVSQRFWCALLLVAAYEGARRVARALRAWPWWAPTVAGLAYALAPRMIAEVGVLTGEIVPTAVLPWVLLPLIHAQQGRLTPRSGGLLSAALILLMGGVNATENLAALPLPVLLVLLGPTLARIRWRLLGWWAGGTVLACLWWLLPLLLLGRYSPPFLDYIETSGVTTSPLSWGNLLRGADHWLMFYSSGGRAWWPAGFAVAVTPGLVVLTSLVAAVGLTGLFVHGMPWRRALVASALLGLACMYVGHAGALSTPIDGVARQLLDGPLAPFRNVHKVDPIVRLPLALGFAHATTLVAGYVPRRVPEVRRATVVCATVLLSAVLLLGSAWPLWTGNLRSPGWQSVPEAWVRTASWLHGHAAAGRALVVPGSGFAVQTWGTTIDEPLQGLARSPWATRGQVPLAPGQTVRFLDAVETRLTSGSGSPDIAGALSRAGIGFLVARSDLDPAQTDAPSVQRVETTIGESPGLELAASFGHGHAFGGSLINIYRVGHGAPRVAAMSASSTRRIVGSPDAIVPALAVGLLRPAQPAIMIGQRAARGHDVVADSYRRVERDLGRVHDAVTGPMAHDDRYRLARRVHDYPATPGVLRADLRPVAFTRATASSSQGYADTLGAVRPDRGPWAAVDGDPATAWVSAPFSDPSRQWLDLRLRRPVPVTTVRIRVGTAGTIPVRAVEVTVGGVTRTAAVDPASGEAAVTFDVARARTLRLAPVPVPGTTEGTVGVREVSFPRMSHRQSLVVPAGRTGPGTSFLFTSDPGRRGCLTTLLGPDCNSDATRPPEAHRAMERTFTLTSPETFSVSGTVVAQASPATASLTQPVGDAVRVTASSEWQDDPSVSGQFAYDGNAATSWLSDQGDPRPSLTLRWPGARTLDRLTVTGGSSLGAMPAEAVLRAGHEFRTIDLRSGFGFFKPVRARQVQLTFRHGTGMAGGPVSIDELHLRGLDGLRYRPDPAGRSGAVCGLGPEVVVDGKVHPTAVSGTVGDIIDGTPLSFHLCGHTFRLGAGRHQMQIRATSQFAPTVAALARPPLDPSQVTSRTVRVHSWSATDRVLSLGPGPRTLVRVPENANPGWRATLNGHPLRPVSVDGWQQGWWVPAGQGGRVQMWFAPDRAYHLSLLVGAASALLVVLLAAWSITRDPRGRGAPHSAARSAWEAQVSPSRLRSRSSRAVMLVLSWVLGGPAVLGGAAAGLLLRRRQGAGRGAPWIGALMIAFSGVAALVAGKIALGRPGLPADILAGAGLGLLVTLLEEGEPSGRAPR